MRTLHKFHGGVHPPDHKTESNRLPIAAAPLPQRLIVPLRQHIGTPATPIVKVGDPVLKGQMIGAADDFISAAVHAPTSGIVSAIEIHAVPHPSSLPDLCITIEPDGEERWIERQPLDYQTADPDAVRARLRDAGIVGLGGAVFPTHVKLSPGQQKIKTLILNGAECEPWITSDDLLMRERAAEIVAGIKIMAHLIQPKEVLIGIEDNKPEAIVAMKAACQGTGFEVVTVPVLYPSGGEKQLIKMLTGKEVPSGQRTVNTGVLCSNTGTAYTMHRAVDHGEPVISRIVTITGNVAKPQNFEALLGTPLSELVQLAGGARPETSHYLIGGPMMGFGMNNLDAPLTKATNCLIAVSPALFPPKPAAMPCIRCTQCAQACPCNLQPQELFWFSQSKNFDKARAYNLFDCIECGCCDYVCPSHIPLVSFFRFAKSEIATQDREIMAAEQAKQRFEFKQMREEREKAEKAARMAEKTAAARAAAAANPDDPVAAAKKAAIQAAVERAKAKKAEAVAAADLPPLPLRERAGERGENIDVPSPSPQLSPVEGEGVKNNTEPS
ncbi:RnfABCDGE type electron transport complex subunit C [Sulfuricella denitrificans skB26]|uniref:Ion-translocating oxidoreductase complex subunit C n=1 Tax=Sulfuricella denitrificans (strain DSM 22764 / NBRC 105220 / skB26) TaxID=1163617 RepID=S6AHZ8_SULDS|nr:electron transport complex subunit RsxC [Sulfuricella denitrificans]BAN35791.1 RnfABCDGE type electron transport complex subunit C [Sulfuricella denitrificans skB26]